MPPTLLTDPNRPCWFVGGAYGGTDDQTARFLREGIWENGWGMGGDNRLNEQVKSMRPGDRIAIKAVFTQKRNLPFPNPGEHTVGGMYIKAIGIVTSNPGNGLYVNVDWKSIFNPHRRWYFSQYHQTLHEILPGKSWLTDALIDFTFNNKPQDLNRFRNAPKWREKFGGPSIAQNVVAPAPAAQYPVETPPENNEADDDSPEPYSLDDIITDGCFLSRPQLQDIIDHWHFKKNLILQGPPGTGKTFLARKLAYALIGQKDETQVQAVQFHPNLSYEDFVRGHRPAADGKLTLIDGPFLNLVSAARRDPDSDYVMVIEEINRGNPAQVFGEMLTLLEADKRDPSEALALSYPKSPEERIHIPPNLYIIGTMNIADRSLALVDLAFRRRFAFEELEPQFTPTWREWVSRNSGIPPQFLTVMQQKLETLNREIADDRTLGRQFRIGHSYVTPNHSVTDAPAWFRRIIHKEIAPLLDEYWFDAPDTARDAKAALLDGLDD